MPGYYLHLAACEAQSLANRSFVLGVEAPDILKKWTKKNGGIEYARTKYNSLRTVDMPNFEEFEIRIKQIEKDNDGLHYGVSSNPNIRMFWNGLTDAQKISPFYRGYCWHLLTDAIMYKRLDIDAKFEPALNEYLATHPGVTKDSPEIDDFWDVEVKKLHLDWDKTNARIRETYPDVTLTSEVLELNVVNYVSNGDLVYVNWDILKDVIEYMRTFNPLTDDMNVIIDKVLDF